MKETAPLNAKELLPQKLTWQSRASGITETNKKSHLKRGDKERILNGRNGRLPNKRLNEMEESKLSDIEFKRMKIRMLKELTDNYKELSGNYNIMNKETQTIKKTQEEMKNAILE